MNSMRDVAQMHQVNTDDGFPNLICLDCVNLLNEAYKFKVQFDHSYSTVQQYLQDCVKEEETKVYIYPDTDSEIGNDNGNGNDYDYDSNVGDRFIETIAQNQSLGKRDTSKKQIQKRYVEPNKATKQSAKRGRKSKIKPGELEESESDDEKYKPTLYPCPICTKEFTALDLREHAHTHKALKKYLMVPINRRVAVTTKFFATPDLKNPNISIHNKKEKLHKCVMCKEEFTANNLRLHLDTHRNQKEFKCNECDRVFKKLNHLNTHKVKHLKEYPYKCDQCGKGFVIKTNYDCHMLTHNSNEELPHECSHCLKRFSNPEHLNRHIIIHTENVSYSVKYKVCKCQQCLQTFRDRTEYKSHVCVPVEHVINTRYPCKSCNKVFKNSSGLYNHNRNIHKLKGAKVLCSVCGNYVSNIYNHMMRHTGEKPFGCNQCGKRFIGKPQLKQHLLVHSGLKPFVCSICAKAFNNLYNLQVHERIHKGNKCHVCPICDKGFLEKSYLKKHMNIHTKL